MRVAFYLRLSVADGDLGRDGKDESNSIENQRLLLKNYILSCDDINGEVVEYIDDGYTGTNFDRPGFMKMINDAKSGVFNTLLVKDLSRLGRDYIGVGDYMDQIFPMLGLRFIAVNSNYDSGRYTGLTTGFDFALDNLVNTMYSRDLSKKRRSVNMTKWKLGVETASRAPYGYVFDRKTKGTWAIDPETSRVVKLIFRLGGNGWSTHDIADHLNEREIPTPGTIAMAKGYITNYKVPEEERLWNIESVAQILKRYSYTGAMVHNVRTVISVGSKHTRTNPKNEWVIVEDVHEPIISKEEFEKGQCAFSMSYRKTVRHAVPNKLRGKIRCGNCGSSMVYYPVQYDGYYYCSHKVKTGKYSKCSDEKYSETDTHILVFGELRYQLIQFEQMYKEIHAADNNQKKDISATLKKLNSEISIQKAERMRQYEKYAEDIIDIKEYQKIKEKISKKIDELQSEINRLEDILNGEKELKEDMDSMHYLAKAVIQEKQLTYEMTDAFIECVYVYDAKHFIINFKFTDLLDKVREKYAALVEGKEEINVENGKTLVYRDSAFAPKGIETDSDISPVGIEPAVPGTGIDYPFDSGRNVLVPVGE